MPEVLKFVLSIDSMPIMPSTITDQTVQLGDVKIPNQCWKGYYDIDTFSKSISDTSKPATYSEYFDFGKSIWNAGCGICAAIGAINFLTNGNFTVLDAYRKGLAIVYKSSNSSLVSFRNSKKFGVDTGDTQHIAYDIGRDYGWAKSSKNYTNTASIITTSKINAYKDLFYLPDGTYHQAKGPYQPGNQSDLKSYHDGAYVAAQAQAIERIKNMYFADQCAIIYINSPVRNCGHYVLAVGYSEAHSGYYSFDDIIVWDPCPINTSTYNNKTQYYGRMMTLTESMKRINCDISDGIRTIQTCVRI